MRHNHHVIGFVGPSSVGKTTLLEAVIPELQSRGLRVGVVKHSCHEVDVDRPGKDSARLTAAGADAVVLAAQNQLVTWVPREMTPRLSDAFLGLPPGLDVVLVEGFASESIPRYVVLPAESDEVAHYAGRGRVMRTIIAPPRLAGGPPQFPAALVQAIALEIALLAGKGFIDTRLATSQSAVRPESMLGHGGSGRVDRGSCLPRHPSHPDVRDYEIPCKTRHFALLGLLLSCRGESPPGTPAVCARISF